ncbi:MAG: response regulator [Proteobacteria bacterium]|nr:response regulator [Pseudomonadota bacterium]
MKEEEELIYIAKSRDPEVKNKKKDRLRREVIRLRAKTADLEALLDGRSAEAFDYFKQMDQANRELTNKIAQHKQTLKALQKSEQLYRELFNTIRDFIFTHDLEGYFITVNPALAARFGSTLKEITKRRITDFVLTEDQVDFEQNYLSQIKKDGFTQGIFKIRTAEGSIRYIEYSSTIVERKRRKAYASVSGRDVTERILAESKLKELQEQLIHAQKMEAVGTLASGIAHDFNNILQSISGYIELMKAKTSSGGPDHSYLLEMENAVDRAATLVRRLLTFGRKVESRFEATDLNQSIEQTVKMLQRTIPKMITLETDLADDLRMVFADPYQLEQIVLNLSANAKDAMPNKGNIVIKTSNVTFSENDCKDKLDLSPGDYVTLIFSDNGIGMDQHTVQRIFEPFFSTKDVGQGTGLGLSTVYGLVNGHGGHITCESLQGVGTTFRILFPALDNQSFRKMEIIEIEQAVEAGDETILIVDDETSILETTQEFLKLYGYLTITAMNGEDAIKILKEKRDGIDLVILDLSMPGMGGVTCLKQIRLFDSAVKIIISSGYIEDGMANGLRECGVSGFIRKPYRMAEFVHRIRSVLDST